MYIVGQIFDFSTEYFVPSKFRVVLSKNTPLPITGLEQSKCSSIVPNAWHFFLQI